MTALDGLLAIIGIVVLIEAVSQLCMWLSRRPLNSYKRRQRARDAARQSKTDAFIPVSLLPEDRD